MRPAPFDYVAPRDVGEVLDAFEPGRHVVLLAGGQSLVPALSRRQICPDLVVDLNGVSALDTQDTDAGGRRLTLGALTRHRWLERHDVVRQRMPVIAAAAALIGDPGVRRRGTLGGSLAHAQPGAQLPVVAVLLDAQLRLASATGERVVRAGEFFLGPWCTEIRAGEVLTSVDVPWAATGEVCAIHRFTAQRHGRNITAAVRIRSDRARIVVSVGRPISLDLDCASPSDVQVRAIAARAAAAVADQDDTIRPDEHPLMMAAVAQALKESLCRSGSR
jgi:CO/xanthine dehydrogenase FAD-binding subunit